jgi:hypothetical protein
MKKIKTSKHLIQDLNSKKKEKLSIFLNEYEKADCLYSVINSQVISDQGYKETFNYGDVKFSKLEG